MVLCSLGHVRLFATPWTVAHQAPLSMGFSRQEYWGGLPCPSPVFKRIWVQVFKNTRQHLNSHEIHILRKVSSRWTTHSVVLTPITGRLSVYASVTHLPHMQVSYLCGSMAGSPCCSTTQLIVILLQQFYWDGLPLTEMCTKWVLADTLRLPLALGCFICILKSAHQSLLRFWLENHGTHRCIWGKLWSIIMWLSSVW